MKIDWSKAPAGTKGFAEIGLGLKPVWFGEGWYEYVGGLRFNFSRHPDHAGRYSTANMVNIHWNPEVVAEWDGTGLPPVGINCQHQGAEEDDSWFPVLILAHAKVDDRYVAVFQRTDDDIEISFSDAVFFRPTMTAEEIAAEEREEAVQQMLSVVKGMDVGMYTICCALYDAGFSKAEVTP